jgi:hypothetical protein
VSSSFFPSSSFSFLRALSISLLTRNQRLRRLKVHPLLVNQVYFSRRRVTKQFRGVRVASMVPLLHKDSPSRVLQLFAKR